MLKIIFSVCNTDTDKPIEQEEMFYNEKPALLPIIDKMSVLSNSVMQELAHEFNLEDVSNPEWDEEYMCIFQGGCSYSYDEYGLRFEYDCSINIVTTMDIYIDGRQIDVQMYFYENQIHFI